MTASELRARLQEEIRELPSRFFPDVLKDGA
jgi:hypothetical protein